MHTSELTAPLLNTSDQLPGILETEMKVRFQDCDPFGHLNNGAYLAYLINAREDQVAKEYGLDIYSWGMTRGTSWVVGKHEIVYRKPAFYNENVIVQSRLIRFADKHIHVEMAMLDAAKTHLKAVLWTSFVHVDMKAKRPAVHVPELMDLFGKVRQELPQDQIDARVRAWSTELAAARG